MAFLDGHKGQVWRSSGRFGIMGYIGANGSGKSLTAVYDTLPSLERGRPCLSTLRLLDYENPRPCELSAEECGFPSHPDHMHPHPLWIPFRSWGDFMDAEGCDVLLDEVTGVASSRDALSLPSSVANRLVQMRRADMVVRWTAPGWGRADAVIRECTQVVIQCSGHFPRRVQGRTWRSNSLIRARAVDKRELADDPTQQAVRKTSSLNNSWYRLNATKAMLAYDSFDQVLCLPPPEGGRCLACGGRRAVPKCSCEGGGVE